MDNMGGGDHSFIYQIKISDKSQLHRKVTVKVDYKLKY